MSLKGLARTPLRSSARGRDERGGGEPLGTAVGLEGNESRRCAEGWHDPLTEPTGARGRESGTIGGAEEAEQAQSLNGPRRAGSP
jgi:hypothetical protein